MNISKGLKRYLDTEILSIYGMSDRDNHIEYIKSVAEESIIIASRLGVNADMAYTIAIYHELGLIYYNDESYGMRSADYLLRDRTLRRWFKYKDAIIMSAACIEHTNSYVGECTSVYSSILSEASIYDPSVIMKRSTCSKPNDTVKPIPDIRIGLSETLEIIKDELYDMERYAYL